ncbi:MULTISPECIES: mannose-1-phosphate guanylyltransferase/mannose-6-phosphate isomerase [Paraburkholderia]|uniref:mannose-1-phosphate guanylyltransferase/mannose-6-phosphate isomerase n=1 Tax=Paraburkholderia TaxID=1822464 RepID=UPI00225479BC|nr:MULTISPECIES: mannose-1-phosphate guanylyltransferase/mannose-6-phosphate isomerase [Paraburkholderia]MCX4172151.1 mannose-1-phosphate guanylyltransferase/mannose-6-phosphate isomerase [Paraburkholderia madseniana]MDQ6460160.1 mannose-1-phosphate guanylyltransferase/mannose-6-phosphate isomerase [Paraburkholderia madseniana]
MNRIVEPGNPIVSAAGVTGKATRLCVQPVILAGGSGTRLWPLSRERNPKQLIGLMGGESLLEATLRRIDLAFATAGHSATAAERPTERPTAATLSMGTPLVMCCEDLRLQTLERLEQCARPVRMVLEPVPRNTAPALTVAALAARAAAAAGDDPILVALPADHLIADHAAFGAALAEALSHAARGAIVTLGVPPQRAETGYGYIRTGMALGARGARAIERFVEKPDAELAGRYVASGEYWWNSGMFVVRASVWLAAIELCRPAIAAACAAAFEHAAVDGDGTLHLAREAFAACPSDSIDYAVMERVAIDARLAGVAVPLVAGWSDVGAWDSVWEASDKDACGNVARGRVMFEDSTDSFAHSEGRLVACVGVSGVVVVETADAVLVAAKDRVQDVKAIVSRLKAEQGAEVQEHRKVGRPWGFYDSLERGERFQVKRIVVKPGGRLSLQMHHHRAEHWIVVRGTARVTRGDACFLLSENQSTYIPLGVTHRLENPGKTPLEMIEVQSGGYLGEDDIVRFDDQYGRDQESGHAGAGTSR